MTDAQWSEIGNSYPSCQDLYVRGRLITPSGNPLLTPPLTLVDARTSGTTAQGTLDLQGLAVPFAGSTRITLRPTNAGAEGQVVRWLTQAGTAVFSMGNDASGVGGAAAKNWWLFDGTRGIYPLYFASDQGADTVGSIRWGNGRISHDSSTNYMTFRVGNVIRVTLTPTDFVVDTAVRTTLAGDASLAGVGKLLGFYGAAGTGKPTIAGSRADPTAGGALGQLLSALAAQELLVDTTTP